MINMEIISLLLLNKYYSLAYIGPGMAGGLIAAIFGIIIAFFFGLIGILFFPIKRIFKRIKNAKTGKKLKKSKNNKLKDN